MSPRTFLRFFSHTQLLPILESGEETLVGGQAVMEGVMMRAPHSYCVAVRRPDGEIVTEELAIPRMSEQNPIWKLPVLRGLGTLGQAMSLGFRAMRFSMANALTEESAPRATPEKAQRGAGLGDGAEYHPLDPASLSLMYKFHSAETRDLGWEAYYPAVERADCLRNGVEGVIRLIIFISFPVPAIAGEGYPSGV